MRTLHVGPRVSEVERSIAFYTALGYEVLGEVPETELGTLTMLKLPGDEFVGLELVCNPTARLVDRGDFSHLVISVDSAHATVADLARQGVVAVTPTSPDGSEDFWTAWLTDPDGYRLELVQWPAGHAAGMTRADLTGPDDSEENGEDE